MNRLLVGLALFAVGCGSISIDDYYKEAVKIECDFAVKCCGSMLYGTTYPSSQACVTANESNTALDDAKAQIKAGTLRYDGSAASSCIDATRSLFSSCSNTETPTGAKSLGSACQNVLVGTGKPGSICDTGDDTCQPGTYCEPTSGNSGTCTSYLKAGADCSDGPCDPDHDYCDDTTMKCTALKSKGAACTSDDECSTEDCASTCIEPAAVSVSSFCQSLQN